MEQLEKQQSENLERFKVRTKELKSSVSKELQEATLDAAGLRRLIQIKNKELRQMKSLAATILAQRTETEQFFLEALQEVSLMLNVFVVNIQYAPSKLCPIDISHCVGSCF